MEATKRVLAEENCGLVLTYRVNDVLLCAPVEHVESVIEPPAVTAIPNAPDYVIGAFMHRGKTALALSLRKLLRLPEPEKKTRKESLLITWVGDQPVGYWVDEIQGMTDSARGHWSAVPALIRDQGITRALVCEGKVYFPLDLTQSSQFKELSRALADFEKNRLQTAEQAPTEEPVDSREAHQDEAVNLLPAEAEQEADSEAAASEPQAVDPESEAGPQLDIPAEQVAAPEASPASDDEYSAADYPASEANEEDYDDPLANAASAEYDIDTFELAKAMHTAAKGEVEVISVQALEFNRDGQADAFLDLLTEASNDTLVQVAEETVTPELDGYPAEAQLDAFDSDYQALLKQDAIEQEPVQETAQEQSTFVEQEETGEYIEDELSLTTESYSYALTVPDAEDIVAEETGEAEQDELFIEDDPAVTGVDATIDDLRQAEIDAIELDDELTQDDLSLTEEPYSFGADTFPTEDEAIEFAETDADESDELLIEDDPAVTGVDATIDELRQAEIDAIELDDEPHIDESIYDEPTQDNLSLIEAPYSFGTDAFPEQDEAIELAEPDADESDELLIEDDPAVTGVDATIDELRQAEIDAIELDDEPHIDEAVYDEPTQDNLSLTDEFMASPLDELDDTIAELPQAEIDTADVEVPVDESIYDEPTQDDLSLTDEFISSTLEEDGPVFDFGETDISEQDDPFVTVPDAMIDTADSAMEELMESFSDDEATVDDLSASDSTESLSQVPTPWDDSPDSIDNHAAATPTGTEEIAPVLLPHMPVEGTGESIAHGMDEDVAVPSDAPVEKERPVIALPYGGDDSAIPILTDKISPETEYYAAMMAAAKEAAVEQTEIDLPSSAEVPESFNEPPPTPIRPDDNNVYELRPPEPPFKPVEDHVTPSLGDEHVVPRLDPRGIIIRPDGQINRNFGLVKLFTIILATSAAGSWWYRDELFYREHIRKDIPSILQNEIAFLYAERVKVITPGWGMERIIVNTPEHEIKVIRANYVTGDLLKQRKKKGVTIHRVKQGETLWSVAERYLDDPKRYPELVENNRLHKPKLIRPGDVVKITKKK